jgi:beta-lactamase superfamily II metal-dependent hydrolase
VKKLRIIIYDVDQGFCAFVKSPNNYTILIDCGKATAFSPVQHVLDNELPGTVQYDGRHLALFILSHPHDDHLEDLERLKQQMPPAVIYAYRSYDWDRVREVSGGEGSENLEDYIPWRETYNQPATYPDWGMNINMQLGFRPNEALRIDKQNFVNNSSIPVFIEYAGWKIAFPGDLMESGWKELLTRTEFRSALQGTDFFVAAHHGHSSGYCEEIFKVMGKPWLNIVSTHSRDPHVDVVYSREDHAKGVEFSGQLRRMLSTRKDGSIFIEISEDCKCTVNYRKLNDNILKAYTSFGYW